MIKGIDDIESSANFQLSIKAFASACKRIIVELALQQDKRIKTSELSDLSDLETKTSLDQFHT